MSNDLGFEPVDIYAPFSGSDTPATSSSPPSQSPPSSSAPLRASSMSPPKKRGIFACLGGSQPQAPAVVDELDMAVPSSWVACMNCPRIEDFEVKIDGCMVRGEVSMDAVAVRQELLQNFTRWMEEERSSENVHCWLALDLALKAALSGDLPSAINQIRALNIKFFAASSPTQVGCVELYPPLEQLLEIVEAADPEAARVTALLTNILKTLENLTLREGLGRWHEFQDV